ncbi:MAG: transcriptional repressor [bacterium]
MNTSRQTKARQALIQILRRHDSPLSLAELWEELQRTLPAVAHSTVFRLITRLEEEGQVVRVDWRERGSRYEWAGLPHHHHIVCTGCGEIRDLADSDLDFDSDRLRRATGYDVTYHSIELEGLCPRCQPA